MQLNPNEYGKIPEIEAHIAHLLTLTESLMDARMRRKFDAQDIVQETMISAYSSFNRMTAPADVGLVRKWLSEILRNKLLDAIRKLNADKRNIRLEQSFNSAFDQSVAGIEALVPADQTSPSSAASRNEQLTRLAEGLRQLSANQREVVVQKYLNRRSIADISEEMERTPESVTGLLRRGLAKLRNYLSEVR